MDTTSLNISLPKALKAYVESQVAQGAYSTPSEYVRGLIRDDRKRQAQDALEAALVDGFQSGPPREATPDYWAKKRKALSKPRKRRRAAR